MTQLSEKSHNHSPDWELHPGQTLNFSAPLFFFPPELVLTFSWYSREKSREGETFPSEHRTEPLNRFSISVGYPKVMSVWQLTGEWSIVWNIQNMRCEASEALLTYTGQDWHFQPEFMPLGCSDVWPLHTAQSKNYCRNVKRIFVKTSSLQIPCNTTRTFVICSSCRFLM